MINLITLLTVARFIINWYYLDNICYVEEGVWMRILGKYLAKLHTGYMNLGFKYKALVVFNSIIILVSIILGTYSYVTSSKMIQDNVTSTNVRDIEQITNSMDFLQKDIYDLSTFICINPTVQSFLRAKNNTQSKLVNNNLESFNNLLASKDYISFIVIYNKNGYGQGFVGQ